MLYTKGRVKTPIFGAKSSINNKYYSTKTGKASVNIEEEILFSLKQLTAPFLNVIALIAIPQTSSL